MNATLKLLCLSVLFSFGCQQETVIERWAEWLYEPTVEICPEAIHLEAEIFSALDWWEDLGYYVDNVYVRDCDEDTSVGVIRIMYDPDLDDRLVDEEEETERKIIAYTPLLFDPWTCDPGGSYPGGAELPELSQMCFATLHLPYKHRRTVIEHELGHAFGWNHVISGGKCHMMHTRYAPLCGWRSDGL